jgi:hypothetical protein
LEDEYDMLNAEELHSALVGYSDEFLTSEVYGAHLSLATNIAEQPYHSDQRILFLTREVRVLTFSRVYTVLLHTSII